MFYSIMMNNKLSFAKSVLKNKIAIITLKGGIQDRRKHKVLFCEHSLDCHYFFDVFFPENCHWKAMVFVFNDQET